MYKSIIRPLLFLFDPEKVHHFSTGVLKAVLAFPGMSWIFRKAYVVKDARLEREVFGLHFPNPIGLAAGFDKDARLFSELGCLGFGFVEIGTLTPVAQSGNPTPRLFRLPLDKGVINRMGFNNGGVELAANRLRKRSGNLIVGGNIGKNKVTPNEEALGDYLKAFHALYEVVDYFVVNVSSPNTPNLRALQEKEPLKVILMALMTENAAKAKSKPILLKIAPDLGHSQLDDIIEIVQETKIAGVIATNTTISRDGLRTEAAKVENIGAGGVSGKPVAQKSTEVIRYLAAKSQKSFAIIGVGGVFDAEDAKEKLAAGADLVQVYTGFIYEGPAMVKKICKGLLK